MFVDSVRIMPTVKAVKHVEILFVYQTSLLLVTTIVHVMDDISNQTNWFEQGKQIKSLILLLVIQQVWSVTNRVEIVNDNVLYNDTYETNDEMYDEILRFVTVAMES
jgi:hypothetical protein